MRDLRGHAGGISRAPGLDPRRGHSHGNCPHTDIQRLDRAGAGLRRPQSLHGLCENHHSYRVSLHAWIPFQTDFAWVDGEAGSAPLPAGCTPDLGIPSSFECEGAADRCVYIPWGTSSLDDYDCTSTPRPFCEILMGMPSLN